MCNCPRGLCHDRQSTPPAVVFADAMRDAVLDDFDASHLSPVAAALFSRARASFADIIAPGGFVDKMHKGALDRGVYAQYLAIDRYFLFHFNRAYAVALIKARTVDEQLLFHELIAGVLDEMRLHVSACARWGVGFNAAMSSSKPRTSPRKNPTLAPLNNTTSMVTRS